MTEVRPELTSALAASDFRSFYWLKEELIRFCRSQGLNTQGSKQELATRIAHYLATGDKSAPVMRRIQGKIPSL